MNNFGEIFNKMEELGKLAEATETKAGLLIAGTMFFLKAVCMSSSNTMDMMINGLSDLNHKLEIIIQAEDEEKKEIAFG